MPTQCTSEELEFETFNGRRVAAAFDGGAVTSDAGTVLLREVTSYARISFGHDTHLRDHWTKKE